MPAGASDILAARRFHGTAAMCAWGRRPAGIRPLWLTGIVLEIFRAWPYADGNRRGMNQTPVTALLAKPGAPVGMHIEAVTGIDARPLRDARRVLGYYWEDADAVYCHLGGVRPTNISASRGDQTRQVLHIIRNILENIGLDFCHVVRTWFYNDHIVDWYAEFNEARTGFFRQRKISVLPASTGIGVANAGGSTSGQTHRRETENPPRHDPACRFTAAMRGVPLWQLV